MLSVANVRVHVHAFASLKFVPFVKDELISAAEPAAKDMQPNVLIS